MLLLCVHQSSQEVIIKDECIPVSVGLYGTDVQILAAVLVGGSHTSNAEDATPRGALARLATGRTSHGRQRSRQAVRHGFETWGKGRRRGYWEGTVCTNAVMAILPVFIPESPGGIAAEKTVMR